MVVVCASHLVVKESASLGDLGDHLAVNHSYPVLVGLYGVHRGLEGVQRVPCVSVGVQNHYIHRFGLDLDGEGTQTLFFVDQGPADDLSDVVIGEIF